MQKADFSIPTPQIPPPRSVDSVHPPTADQETKGVNPALEWLTEVQRQPLPTLPPYHWAEMGSDQGGKYKPKVTGMENQTLSSTDSYMDSIESPLD